MRRISDPADGPEEPDGTAGDRGEAPPRDAPVFEALCVHYSRGLPSGGDVRWLRHAWSTLAVVGVVPVEIPERGIEGADARIRLAALALLAASYDGTDEDAEPPEILAGPHPLAASDMAAWMAAHDLQTVAQLQAEAESVDPDAPAQDGAGPDDAKPRGADPDHPGAARPRDRRAAAPDLCTEDIEFAIDAVAGDVIGAYSRLRPNVIQLFAELWVQSYPASDPGDADDSRNGGPFMFPHSTYPLPGSELLMIINDNGSDVEKRAAVLRLMEQLKLLGD
ncbi:hypothetical protein I8D64_04125 [Brachybacterium sp. MASK1Z-5]|uniref:Uncharacterized protein n=1 Tax=Brachybacterium halotolerans TaxID=2795215 RepID=A0ABS1B7I6_9MICO|nr:hypothetical protein [Brachybacterium halotolerans]MBK0330584.1 hypothetical protein [Brachybacterium halotolerans]